MDVLDKASDYERGLGRMNKKDKAVVRNSQIFRDGMPHK